MGKPVVKRGRKALETLNKVSPVAVTTKKVRGSCFATGLFSLLQQEKYINIIGKKRGKNSRHAYTKKGGK